MGTKRLRQNNNAARSGIAVARAQAGDYAAIGGVSSFTRADATTCASYNSVASLVATVAANVLRDSHYIGGYRTILLETGKASLIKPSEDFSTGWTTQAGGGGSAPVVTVDQTTAPDGASTADKVVFAAPVSGDLSLLNSSTFTATLSANFWADLWVKAFAAGDLGKTLVFRHAAAAGYLTTPALSTSWQRVGRLEVGAGGSQNISIGLRPSVGGSTGTVSCYLWGAYERASALQDSYINSGASLITRATDALSYVGAKFGGTLFYHYYDLATAAWVSAVAAYTANTTITPPVDRAYYTIAVVQGTRTAAECKAILGGTFPT